MFQLLRYGTVPRQARRLRLTPRAAVGTTPQKIAVHGPTDFRQRAAYAEDLPQIAHRTLAVVVRQRTRLAFYTAGSTLFNCRHRETRKAQARAPAHAAHTYGHALADKGADARLIQDYLGHRDLRHTRRYTRTAARRFEGLWE